MRGKVMFLGGLAAGFVLGSRAGRQAYDRLAHSFQKVRENPTVQEAAGAVQHQATKLYAYGKETATDKFGHTRMGERVLHDSAEPVGARRSRVTPPSNFGDL